MRSHPWLNVCTGALLGITGALLIEAGLTPRVQVSSAGSFAPVADRPTLSKGTPVLVRLNDPLSSETARRGDPWRGVTARDLVAGDGGSIPRGSAVSGIVSDVRPSRGARATLGLRVITIHARGRSASIRASVHPGSAIETYARATTVAAPRSRATAGPLGVVVAAAPGMPLVFREGTVMTFRVQ